MDKALTPSIKLNSSQVSNSNTGANNTVTNNNLSNANVSVNRQQMASVQLPSSDAALSTLQIQLSVKQASALQSNPTLLLLTQQQALLFLQSQLINSRVSLSPELVKLTSVWFNQIKQSQNKESKSTNSPKFSFSDKNMPAQLVALLSQSSNMTISELMQKLQSIQLKLNTLEFSFLQGEPITQIKLPQQRNSVSSEQLQQTLQFLIPLGFDCDSSLLIKRDLNEDHHYSKQDEDTLNAFELTFNLDNLGKLVIKVELNEFKLATKCMYSNLALEHKAKRFWPQLTSRLEKLGFAINNKFQLKPELEQTDVINKRSGLIDTQV